MEPVTATGAARARTQMADRARTAPEMADRESGPAVLLTVEQLLRPVPGGIGTYIRGLLQGLGDGPGDRPTVEPDGGDGARRAHEAAAPSVALLSARGKPEVDGSWPVHVSPLSVGALTRAWDLGILRAPRNADVVHATSLAFPLPGRGRPLVVTVHDLAWRELPGTFTRRGRRWHEQALLRALRCAHRFVVPSTATADALMAMGVVPATIEVIEHGVDHLAPPDAEGASALLRRLGVSGPYVVAVGTVEPRKNLARLRQAHARVRSALAEPVSLVVVGPAGWAAGATGTGAGGQNAAVPATPGTDGTVFTGAVGAGVLSGLISRAICLAYVPLHEGFGLPALEAMSLGTPVVASPIPSAGDAALAVDPLDADDIARGLAAVLSDEGLRSDLVARGRERARRHRWADAAAAHLALWASLAGGTR